MGSLNDSSTSAAVRGSNSALAIAFTDLKRRFLNQQVELNHIKYNNLQLTTELEHTRNSIHIQERKITQLEETLKSKTLAYESLEETYKEVRNNENILMVYIKENECIVNTTITAHQNLQKENQHMRLELKKLSEKYSQIQKENKELTEELNHLKNTPDIFVDVKNHQKIPNNEHALITKAAIYENENDIIKLLKKQVIDLLSEKQTLKTNIHWLTLELNTFKNNHENKPARKRNLSETLEEAGGGSFDKNNSLPENDTENMNPIFRKGLKLHKFINHLKQSLTKNTVLIDKLHDKKNFIEKGNKNMNTMEHSFEVIGNVKEKNNIKKEFNERENLTLYRMNSTDFDIDFDVRNFDIPPPPLMNDSTSSIDILIHKDGLTTNSSENIETVNNCSLERRTPSNETVFEKKPLSNAENEEKQSSLSENTPTERLSCKEEANLVQSCKNRSGSGDSDLPKTLLDNIHLLQTQTYLTEKTLYSNTSSAVNDES